MKWEEIWSQISSVCVDLAFKLLASALIFIVGRALIRFFVKHFPKGSKKHPLDPTVHTYLKNVVRGVLYVLLIVAIVGVLGIPLASAITVIGAAGAAIALALQGSLANFASGIMLLIFKPFKLGDFIESGSFAGTVIDLGTFYTTLRTPDNKHVTIPNSSLTTGALTNYSSESIRRVDLVFSVAYGSDLNQAMELLMATAKANPVVLADPVPFVRLSKMAGSSLDLTMRVWVNSADYWTAYFDLMEQGKNNLDAAGIEIPFQQLDVHMR